MTGVFIGLSWGLCIALLLYTLAQRLVWVGSLTEVMICLHFHLIFLSVYLQAVLSRVIHAPSSPCITIPASLLVYLRAVYSHLHPPPPYFTEVLHPLPRLHTGFSKFTSRKSPSPSSPSSHPTQPPAVKQRSSFPHLCFTAAFFFGKPSPRGISLPFPL